MADISGPCSTLPYSRSASPDGVTCDQHPDRAAVGRIQGETDSFGAEYHDLCQDCIDEMLKHRNDDRCGVCEWCKKEAKDLRDRRDWEEGSCGRVYRVCGKCVRKENAILAEELDESDLVHDDYYGDDD